MANWEVGASTQVIPTAGRRLTQGRTGSALTEYGDGDGGGQLDVAGVHRAAAVQHRAVQLCRKRSLRKYIALVHSDQFFWNSLYPTAALVSVNSHLYWPASSAVIRLMNRDVATSSVCTSVYTLQHYKRLVDSIRHLGQESLDNGQGMKA